MQEYRAPTSRIRGLLAAMRLPSCLVVGFGVVLGEAIASQLLSAIVVSCGFMTGFFLWSTNMLLGAFPVKTVSEIGGTQPSEAVKRNEAISLAIILASFGLLFAAYLGLGTLLIALLTLAFVVVYHAGANRLDLIGDAFVGASIGLLLIYAGFAVGNLTWSLTIFAAMTFLVTTAREIMKRVEAPGTVSKGYLEHRDPAKSGKRSAAFFLATVAVSALPIVFGLVTSYYLPLAFICDIGLLLTSYSMMMGPTQHTARRNQHYVLLWMGFGLLAFLIGGI